jgi:large subunit ribosomal protein L24
MKLKKGDKVIVIAGKDKGKEGVVERIYKKSNKVILPQINMYKKTLKKSDQNPQGGVQDVPRPIDASNVMLKCPKTGKPTKVGWNLEKGKKVRFSKKSNDIIK